ncbi:hypothetical protein [Hyalangium minutum]|nr:hypothetical protein [Hyalangium minutum]
MGACALLSGCRERERHEQTAPVAARAPAPTRPSEGASPERISPAPTVGTEAPQATAPGVIPGAAPGPVQAEARTGTSARTNTAAPATTAPATATASPAPSTASSTGAPSGTAQAAPEGRVMIGFEAVQAREDESWYEGAAKAARAFGQNDSVPLDRVVIATGTVDGRVTRVGKSTLHLKDTEGNVYELRIDKRSRGVRAGQSVPLRQLEEGTSVRASFDLVGDDSIARDIEVRR